MQVNVDSQRGIYQQAIRYLSYREYAVEELRLKLQNKFGESSYIEQILCQLLEDDLLSEQRYAESYIRARVSKGCGPERIQNELLQKRIERTIIERAFAELEVAWEQEIHKVWLKKFGNNKAESAQEKAKQWRFLQYRGFLNEQIRMLLGSL